MDRAIVTIELPAGESYEFRLTRASFTVGRAGGCDLALPSSAVSGVHAEFNVDNDTAQAWVTDLASKNGTFVDDIRIAPHGAVPITPQTSVRIANVVLRVRAIGPSEHSDSISSEPSQSLSRSLLRGMLGDAVRQNRASLEVVKGPAKGAKLIVDESTQRVAVGTGPGVQLDLQEPTLAGRPLLLLCTGHAYHLVPSPAVPVKVGGTVISQPHRLRSGDQLRVAKTALEFTDPLQDAIDELEGLDRGDDPATRNLPDTAEEPNPTGAPPSRAPARAWTALERFVLGFAVASLLVALIFLLAVLGVLPS